MYHGSPGRAGRRRSTRPLRQASAGTQAGIATTLNELQRDINRLLAPTSERTTWGVLVKSLATNDTLYALNPRKLFLPASNMKLATLAAAAERLGWAYSYETRLIGHGTLHPGFLDGDLLVVGSGDPSIDDWDGAATRLFQSWAEQLKASGVDHDRRANHRRRQHVRRRDPRHGMGVGRPGQELRDRRRRVAVQREHRPPDDRARIGRRTTGHSSASPLPVHRSR